MLVHRGFVATVALGLAAMAMAQGGEGPSTKISPPPSASEQSQGAELMQKLLDTVHQMAGQSPLNPNLTRKPEPPHEDEIPAERDPFSTTSTMEAEAAKLNPPGTTVASPMATRPLPLMYLRGVGSSEAGGTVAMLEVTGDGMRYVREGEKLEIRSPGAAKVPPLEMTIQEIQPQGEFVKVRSQGETVEVRDPGKGAPRPARRNDRPAPASTTQAYPNR